MDSNFNISGLAELQAQLDQLPALIERKLMRSALRAGMKVTADIAKQMVPVAAPSGKNAKLYGGYAGALRDSIRISTGTRGTLVRARLRAGNKTAYYAHMVEYGTIQHYIKPITAKSLFFAGINRELIDHPGAHKHPFMRPALDAAAVDNSPAFQAVAAYLQGRIGKELAMLPDEQDSTAKP